MKPWPAFEIRVPGKWVLAGEHSVIRGGTSVAIPHPQFDLKLQFRSGTDGFRIFPESASSVILEILRSVREDFEKSGEPFAFPQGELRIESSIPIGAGLGSSAALCVAMSRWMAEALRLRSEEIVQFATRLEHRFHGRSSGMDVAVIAANEPISFVIREQGQSGVATSLGIKRLPRFTFHDTELRTRTSDCVLQVEKLKETDPCLAAELDEKMSRASQLCIEGLIQYDRQPGPEGLRQIAEGMKAALSCYEAWRLIPEKAQQIQRDLLAQGALAVRITGAGGGGMIVALWPDAGSMIS